MENVPNPSEAEKTELPKVTQKTAAEKRAIEKWQNRLLPWLVIMPTVLIGIFIYLATQQVKHFNKAIEIQPDSVLIGKILPSPADTQLNVSLKNDKQYLQWVTLSYLEQESMYRRYNQGGLLLMSRIFVKYLGFFTGMILAIVGAIFIIGKLSEDYTGLSGSVGEHAKLNLISSSPGIIFGVLGTSLMLATILQHNDITIQDSPLYLNANGIISVNTANYFSKKPAKDKNDKNTLNLSEADLLYDSLSLKKIK
jgi:hypothetical protein